MATMIGPDVQEMVNLIAGPLALGSYVATMFWTAELILFFHYLSRFWRSDHWFLRSTVIILVATDTVLVVTEIVGVYKYTVSFWGNTTYLTSQDKSLPRYEILVGLSAAIVQGFLIFRYYKLSKNWLVCIFLFLCTMTAFVSAILIAVLNLRFDKIEERTKLTTIVTIFAAVSAGTDVLIAALLAVTLYKWRGRTSNIVQRSLIVDLIITSVETGTFTAFWAIGVLLAFLFKKNSNVGPGLAFPLGHAYALTMLFNLLLRKTPQLHSTKLSPSIDGSQNPKSAEKFPMRTRVVPVSDVSVLNPLHINY
ncbi:hypothetical protein BT69DRAFT_1086364 [Atractiella rhizophila]|nr:hypothetical protein BT69DRAFT_1086364 [Atractiella rhizophila]